MGEPATKVEEDGVDTLEEANKVVEDLGTAEVELDEDGNEIAKVVELEEWEKTGEEPIVGEDGKLPDVPVDTHIKAKAKWKRKSEAKDTKIEELEAKIEALSNGSKNPGPKELKRPDPLDFENDEDLEEAQENYLLAKIELKNKAGRNAQKSQQLIDNIKAGVDVHNERVSDFLEEKKINPDVYSAAESVFVSAIEDAFPGQGETNADFFLSKLGVGSEKIPYFIGRNKAKLAEFKELLKNDTSGISAAMFLSDQNRKLRGVTTGKQKSKAPKPASTASGDMQVKTESASEKAMKSKYDKAHKEGNGGLAFDIKMQAKREHKINTSNW